MRRPLSPVLLLCVAALLAAGGLPAPADIARSQGSVQVTVSAPDNLAPGESFTASVNISQVSGFDAAVYDVSFPAATLRLNGVDPGLIGSTPIPVDIWNQISPGKYTIVQNVPGLPGVTGSGYLAVLRFTATGAGTASIALSNGSLSHVSLPTVITATWSGDTVTVVSTDPTPPVIGEVAPRPETTVAAASVAISAAYSDIGSGINTASVILLVDDVNVTSRATVTASTVSYTAASLVPGEHSVEVTVSDATGNRASRKWFFYVASAATPATPPPSSPAPGATRVSESVRSDGVFTAAVTARSEDAKCLLSIPSGTRGLTAAGLALAEITMVQQTTAPSPPPDSRAVGRVYDLGPDGATFSPPLSLTFTYSKAELPAGVAEENLVVASRDRTSGQWSKLPSAVAPQTSTITAQVSHFTSFAVLAYTRPAAFTASQLNVVPSVVDSGATITISALIANTGDLSANYKVTLKIDGTAAGTQEVTLRGGASQQVTFTTSQKTAGSHTVAVDSLSGTFEVRAAPAAFVVRNLSISPGAGSPGQPVSISVEVVNTGGARGTHKLALQIDGTAVETREVGVNPGEIERVTFSVTRDVPKSHAVSLGGLSGAFQVAAAAPGQSAAPAGAPPPPTGAPAESPPPAPPTPPPPPSDMPVSPAVLGGVAGAIVLVWLIVRLARRGGGY